MVFPKIIFSFPCCFFFGMMVPLNFAEFDSLSPSNSFCSLKNLDRFLLVSEITFQLNLLQRYGILQRSLFHFWMTFLKLTHMKHIMNCSQRFWQFNLIIYVSFTTQNFEWSNISWGQFTFDTKPLHSTKW